MGEEDDKVGPGDPTRTRTATDRLLSAKSTGIRGAPAKQDPPSPAANCTGIGTFYRKLPLISGKVKTRRRSAIIEGEARRKLKSYGGGKGSSSVVYPKSRHQGEASQCCRAPTGEEADGREQDFTHKNGEQTRGGRGGTAGVGDLAAAGDQFLEQLHPGVYFLPPRLRCAVNGAVSGII